MGRRYGAEIRKRVNVYLNEMVLTKLQLIYFDPARGRPQYGAISDIVNKALVEHLERLEENAGKQTSETPYGQRRFEGKET